MRLIMPLRQVGRDMPSTPISPALYETFLRGSKPDCFSWHNPHTGHSNSFAALLEILDPQRFCRGVPVKGPKLLEQVMVRRLKEDLRQIEGGFPERNINEVGVKGL